MMRPRRAGLALLALAAVTLTPSARLERAEGAPFSMTLPSAGTCSPPPDDPDTPLRTIRALDIGPTSTKPIAVLSTGVDPSAPQLAGRVLQGYDARTGSAVSGDPDGHGTGVAGLAAGAGPGVRGVSPGSPILPIRIGGPPDRVVAADALARGIALAVDHGAGAILIAGSGPLADPPDAGTTAVARAVDAAVTSGVLVVAEAGTSTLQGGLRTPTTPASLPHVLAVGNATLTGERVTTSGIGPWIDLLAPGDRLGGPLPLQQCAIGFGLGSGTSFAAPAVAAAAVLASARRPKLTTQQLFELVRRGADDLGPAGRDDETGFGLLDLATVLSAPPQAKESVPEVDDDPFWVRGTHAKRHAPLLTRKRTRAAVHASVSAAKDPADVFPVSLVKGDRLEVTATAADPGAVLDLSVLSPAAGAFDVSSGSTGSVLATTDGVTAAPRLTLRAARSGLHYLVVRAADAVDPDDPQATPSPQDPYQLTTVRRPAPAKAAAKRRTRRR